MCLGAPENAVAFWGKGTTLRQCEHLVKGDASFKQEL